MLYINSISNFDKHLLSQNQNQRLRTSFLESVFLGFNTVFKIIYIFVWV